MSFHKKMYEDAPTLKRKEDGKMGVSKKEKSAANVDAQVDGMPIHDKEMVELTHKHSKERLEMHHKHEKEIMEHMHKKGKEHMESKGSGDGEEKIKKVEKGEK